MARVCAGIIEVIESPIRKGREVDRPAARRINHRAGHRNGLRLGSWPGGHGGLLGGRGGRGAAGAVASIAGLGAVVVHVGGIPPTLAVGRPELAALVPVKARSGGSITRTFGGLVPGGLAGGLAGGLGLGWLAGGLPGGLAGGLAGRPPGRPPGRLAGTAGAAAPVAGSGAEFVHVGRVRTALAHGRPELAGVVAVHAGDVRRPGRPGPGGPPRRGGRLVDGLARVAGLGAGRCHVRGVTPALAVLRPEQAAGVGVQALVALQLARVSSGVACSVSGHGVGGDRGSEEDGQGDELGETSVHALVWCCDARDSEFGDNGTMDNGIAVFS